MRVGDGHHGGVKDLKVGKQMVLDLLGRDLLACPVDVVAGAALHGQVAAGQAPDDVANVVEAVGVKLRACAAGSL